MKITVVGIGYVGISLAVLLSQTNEVCLLDIDSVKVDAVNKRISPIVDNDIQHYLVEKQLNLTATLDRQIAYRDAEYVIIATPTDYDPDKNYFNTSSVEIAVSDAIKFAPTATIVIKSTIPIGFTENLIKKTGHVNILFSPEFLREGKALYDNLYPSRIVVGYSDDSAKPKTERFSELLKENAIKKDISILLTGLSEAESIKLFANTYLALRVAFFNELDSFAQIKGLNAKQIIDGVGLDSRIGNHYNNPSFGYGGYCLPKDTLQLLANYHGVPNDIINAVVKANATRKQYIADEVIKNHCKTVGIYRLTMKSGSDNFRQSSVLDIINILHNNVKSIIIYEPTLHEKDFMGCEVVADLNEFKEKSDTILANRYDDSLNDCKTKVYTRDLYFRD